MNGVFNSTLSHLIERVVRVGAVPARDEDPVLRLWAPRGREELLGGVAKAGTVWKSARSQLGSPDNTFLELIMCTNFRPRPSSAGPSPS